MEELLGLRVEHIERTCAISETQRNKIEVAGKGDIKRFFDTVEEQRRRMHLSDGEQELSTILEELNQAAMALVSGVFDERSLLQKTMKQTLSHDQMARYQADRRAARAFQHRAEVATTVGIFAKALGLDAEERLRLTNFLLSETRPLRFAADQRARCRFVLAQAVHFPKSKFEPIFTKIDRGLVGRLIDELKEAVGDELNDLQLEEPAIKADGHEVTSDSKPRADAAKPAANGDSSSLDEAIKAGAVGRETRADLDNRPDTRDN